jgi:hypothetical protein
MPDLIKVQLDGEDVYVNEEDFDTFKERYLNRGGEVSPEFKDTDSLSSAFSQFSSQIVNAIANIKPADSKEAPPITRVLVKNVKRGTTGLIQGCELEVQR